jgi:hypothetical protein
MARPRLSFSSSWRAALLAGGCRVQRRHIVAQCRAVDAHKDQAQAVGHVLHQRGLAVAGRRDQQQQAHAVGAVAFAGGAELLGQVVAHQGQVDLVDQAVAHKAGQRLGLELLPGARRALLLLNRLCRQRLQGLEAGHSGRGAGKAAPEVVQVEGHAPVVHARVRRAQAVHRGRRALRSRRWRCTGRAIRLAASSTQANQWRLCAWANALTQPRACANARSVRTPPGILLQLRPLPTAFQLALQFVRQVFACTADDSRSPHHSR